jgi:hypothetical protein
MEYELTSAEKSLVTWMVEANAGGELDESFRVLWYLGGADIDGYSGSRELLPDLDPDMLDALEEEGLLRSRKSTKETTSTHGTKKNPKVTTKEIETGRRCTLLIGPGLGFMPFPAK